MAMMASQHGVGGGGVRYNKFFKVLLPGSYEITLSLPPKFAANLGVLCPPWRAAATATATATLRDRAGRSWVVDIHRDAGHQQVVSFTGSGWRGFVSANAISAGQLLVFEHRGCGFDFAVDRFDSSGCCCACDDNNGGHAEDEVGGGPNNDNDNNKVVEQQHTAKKTKTTTTEATTVDKESGGVKRKRRSPSTRRTTVTTVSGGGNDKEDQTMCIRIERPYQLRFLDLSKEFCDRVGWSSSRDVVLCCAAGDSRSGSGDSSRSRKKEKKRWQVSVKVSGKSKSGMMCAGWAEFARDNGLNISDACVFVPAAAAAALPVPADNSSSSSAGGSHHHVLGVHFLRGMQGQGATGRPGRAPPFLAQ